MGIFSKKKNKKLYENKFEDDITSQENIVENLDKDILQNFIRTDMADELDVEVERLDDEHIKRSQVALDEKLSKKFGKPEGNYITVESDVVQNSNKMRYKRLAEALCEAIVTLGDELLQNCLVIGLGNPNMTADALGSKVTDKLLVTRHLPKVGKGMSVMSALCPNVLGVTGIESYDIIKGVVERTKPQLIIAVDSLASASTGRIASAFQVSNAGIVPGSGVGNGRFALNEKNLGCKVISVGVPLVVYATTIVGEVIGDDGIEQRQDFLNEISSLVVTPKDIDLLVNECAYIISLAINMAVHKDLEMSDIETMVG